MRAAPAYWSTAATGAPPPIPPSTTTSGRLIANCCRASTAALCGAIRMIPSNPLRAESADGLLERSSIEGAHGGHADEVAGGPGGEFDPVEGRGRPVERGVEADDAERLGSTGHPGARGDVGVVVELAHGGQHAGPGLVAHAGALVDDPGDRHLGHTGQFGDIAHDRWPVEVPGAGLVRPLRAQLVVHLRWVSPWGGPAPRTVRPVTSAALPRPRASREQPSGEVCSGQGDW